MYGFCDQGSVYDYCTTPGFYVMVPVVMLPQTLLALLYTAHDPVTY